MRNNYITRMTTSINQTVKQTNISIRVSLLNKHDINFKINYKIVHEFVAKLLKFMILFKDILIFLVLDYRDSSLKILCLVPKSDE